MITVSVKSDIKRARAALDDLGRTQIPFATARAINATLLQAQDEQRKAMAQRFIIRRPDFAKRAVKISRADFATKKNPAGAVSIDGPGADVFAKFEVGGAQVAIGGRTYRAVPRVGSIVKRRPTSIVPTSLRPASIRQLLSLRTFVKPYKGKPDQLGIFAVDRLHESRLTKGGQRRRGKAPTQRDVRRARPQLLYALERVVKLRPALDFVKTVTNVVRARFVASLDVELAKAIAKARAR